MIFDSVSDYLFQQLHSARKTIHLLMHDTFLLTFWSGRIFSFYSSLNTMVRLWLWILITIASNIHALSSLGLLMKFYLGFRSVFLNQLFYCEPLSDQQFLLELLLSKITYANHSNGESLNSLLISLFPVTTLIQSIFLFCIYTRRFFLSYYSFHNFIIGYLSRFFLEVSLDYWTTLIISGRTVYISSFIFLTWTWLNRLAFNQLHNFLYFIFIVVSFSWRFILSLTELGPFYLWYDQ